MEQDNRVMTFGSLKKAKDNHYEVLISARELIDCAFEPWDCPGAWVMLQLFDKVLPNYRIDHA